MTAGIRAYLRALHQRHIRALVRHPHHYGVAFVLTLVVWLFFKIEAATFTSIWLYAVLENLTTIDAE